MRTPFSIRPVLLGRARPPLPQATCQTRSGSEPAGHGKDDPQFRATRVIPEPFDGDAPLGIQEDAPLPPERPEPSSGPVRGLVFEDIYRTQGPRLQRRFRRRADRDEAQDLLHYTFVRFARIDPEARDAIDSIPAYLTRVASNLLRDRGKAFRRSGLLQLLDEEHDMLATSDPLAALESRDILGRVEAAMRHLTPTTREIFMARRLDGLSHAEIAKRTGLAAKTVEWHMTKALIQLHRVLKTR